MTTICEPSSKAPECDAELDQLWDSFLNSAALLSDGQVEDVERMQQSHEYTGRPRRGLLASACFTGAELVGRIADRETAVAFAQLAICGEAWLERQRALMNIAEAQVTRLRMALVTRDDMAAVLAEAEAGLD